MGKFSLSKSFIFSTDLVTIRADDIVWFFPRTPNKASEFSGICKEHFHFTKNSVDFRVILHRYLKTRPFCIVVGLKKYIVFAHSRVGDRWVLASMRKLRGHQPWQTRDTFLLVVTCDPRMNWESGVWEPLFIFMFINFLSITQIEKYTCWMLI